MSRQTKWGHRHLQIGLLALFTVVTGVCTDEFTSINTPSDRITVENIDASMLGQAFGKTLFSGIFGEDQPTQTAYSHYGDIYSQYFSQTAANFDSDQFQSLGRRPNYIWERFYTDVAPQLKLLEDITAESDLMLENAVTKIWKALVYHRMSDYWGPIIYSQFGNSETSVAYDSQAAVYEDIFATLADAVSVLEQSPGGEVLFGQHDLIYGGNADQWRKLANSLRLRLAMRISLVDAPRAQQIAETAVAAGVITSNADNAKVAVNENSPNGYVRITDWGEFRMSAAMESALKGYNDPRLEVYYDPALTSGDYRGLRNGVPRVLKPGTLNRDYSNMNAAWRAPGFPGPPYEVLRAAEVYFLRAEGALRGWSMGGTAQELYEQGVRMSMQEYTDAPPQEVEEYVAGTSMPVALNDPWESPPVADIPVRFDVGGSFEKQLEQIITQKWIGLYPDGHEAWAERRRTGYPIGYAVLSTLNPDIPTTGLFRRVQFTETEYSTNAAAVTAATEMLGGPDVTHTRLWWDVKPLSEYPTPRN